MNRILLFVIMAPSFWSVAQEKEKDNFPPPEKPFEIVVSKSKGEIKLDGVLNEADWSKALVNHGKVAI